jgi:hypothetical protein
MTEFEVPDEKVEVRLPSHIKTQLTNLAVDLDITLGQLMRLAVKALLDEYDQSSSDDNDEETTNSVSKQNVKVRRVEECRVVIAEMLKTASSWSHAQTILKSYGLEYFERGGGLAVRWFEDQEYICKASEAGPGYSKLISKFSAAFPGHSHTWLAERVLDEVTSTADNAKNYQENKKTNAADNDCDFPF